MEDTIRRQQEVSHGKILVFCTALCILAFLLGLTTLEAYIRLTRPRIDLYVLTGRIPGPNPIAAFRGIYRVIDEEIPADSRIDLTVLSGRSDSLYDHIHPTPKGAQEIASIVSQALVNYSKESGEGQQSARLYGAAADSATTRLRLESQASLLMSIYVTDLGGFADPGFIED